MGYYVINSGLPDEVQVLDIVRGEVNFNENTIQLAKPESTLRMGMCGGAVLNESGECIGMLEGLVNPPSSAQSPSIYEFHNLYQGSGVIVPISQILP